jgi:hypothetical protein
MDSLNNIINYKKKYLKYKIKYLNLKGGGNCNIRKTIISHDKNINSNLKLTPPDIVDHCGEYTSDNKFIKKWWCEYDKSWHCNWWYEPVDCQDNGNLFITEGIVNNIRFFIVSHALKHAGSFNIKCIETLSECEIDEFNKYFVTLVENAIINGIVVDNINTKTVIKKQINSTKLNPVDAFEFMRTNNLNDVIQIYNDEYCILGEWNYNYYYGRAVYRVYSIFLCCTNKSGNITNEYHLPLKNDKGF